jgi:gamma-glutamylputrescine oxidase
MQTSIWEKETFFAPQDVLIIGSGFTGLWSALALKAKRPQLQITLLESGWIPTGASTRNAGFACFGTLSEIIQDSQQLSETALWQLIKNRYDGIARIRQHFSDASIDFLPYGGYELFTDNTAAWGLAMEKMPAFNALLKDITGQTDVFSLADAHIAGLGLTNTRHLIFNPLEGQLHSGKLLCALLQKAQGLGVKVFNNTKVTGIADNSGEVQVHTANGYTFRAAQLLLCTNAFTKTLLPEMDITPARGQVLLTSEIPGLRLKGNFHYDAGFYYFRNLGNRVLLGGARNVDLEGEHTLQLETSDTIQQALEDFLSTVILPQTDYTIEHRWSGIMGMGSEKSPIVTAISNRVFAAVRMSGMGVALAPVVANEIAEKML